MGSGYVSPFKQDFPVMSPVEGVQLATTCSGTRYEGRDDLLLVELAEGSVVSGVLTTNQMCGAPIPWCREVLNIGKARALIVNAGIANVFTGEQGFKTVLDTATAVASALSIEPSEVLVASTGTIGEQINTDKIVEKVPDLVSNFTNYAWEAAGKAIMTTDTFAKGVTRTATIGDTRVTINGIVKGSGMIEPNMATMLSYVFTDATIPQTIMDAWMVELLPLSYHAITVDSDTSTSDMVINVATCKKDHWPIHDPHDPAWTDFREKFFEVHKELAQLVVRDGEGISKFVTVHVRGAADDVSALKIAKSIANSPLVKTAVAGEDANWGRIAAAAGKCGEPCNLNASCVWVGQYLIALNGADYNDAEISDVDAYMKGDEILLAIDVGIDDGEATAYTCDLTHEYIRINADYRS